jgi:hypothetical protein
VVRDASEHDDAAGTERRPNTIFAFDLDGIRVAHFGDFGQHELRAEQAAALEGIDLLFLPVGSGPTIGAAGAAEIVKALAPRWVVPMHYRTPRTGFLETEEEFVGLMPQVERRRRTPSNHGLPARTLLWSSCPPPLSTLFCSRSQFLRRLREPRDDLRELLKPSSVSPYCPEA